MMMREATVVRDLGDPDFATGLQCADETRSN